MSRRSEKVSEAIRREASRLIKEELRDPRIGFVTITKATITEDLRSAIIYFSVLGDEKEKKKAEKGLTSALPYLNREIARALKLRYAPHIRLSVDDTFDHIDRINNLLKKIDEEKAKGS